MTPDAQPSPAQPTRAAQPDAIAQRYIRLAHALDAHSPGYIDGYGGPAELADRSLRPLSEMRTEVQRLIADVQVADVRGAELPAPRRGFLLAQLGAMDVLCRILGGEQLPYAEEVRGLYGTEPLRTERSSLDAARAELDAALPGHGDLSEREEAVRRRVTVPPAELLRVTAPILAELRRRTDQRFGLPGGEDFSTELVTGQPWSGYNWPLGNLRSRIDINTDLPICLTGLPDLMAHEGYPGHHTEHATKEARLVREFGWFEHSVQLINAPECLVSEGVAVNALSAVMTPAEVGEWLRGELATLAHIDPEAVEAALRLARAHEGLSGVSGQAALMLHEGGAPEREVLDFLRHYNASSEARARKRLAFISQPTFRAYIFNYSAGGKLIREALERGAVTFGQLLREPLTPAELAPAELAPNDLSA
ncbi:hypothetical protein [Deinococcus sp.]|uniref:hypothetical protein n=1 Tax=Deinococcus sp. TaxID=47478 RepID=UPI0025D290AA|nr:hypothetical protein [Deinococcus sp.]